MIEHPAREPTLPGSSDRAFGIVFAIVFALVGAWPLWSAPAPRWWAFALAAAFGLAALLRPRLLAPLNRWWTRFGALLGKVVSPLVLGLLFYCVFTPVGALRRLTGADPLRLRRDPAAASYWIERRPPGPAPDSMTRQY